VLQLSVAIVIGQIKLTTLVTLMLWWNISKSRVWNRSRGKYHYFCRYHKTWKRSGAWNKRWVL